MEFFGNHGGGFVPIPFPFWPPQRQGGAAIEQEPPMRVRIAMQFLHHLTSKTSDGGIPHGVGCEIISGQKLLPAETRAQTAACDLLHDYFRGELKPDTYEEQEKEEKQKAGKLISCFLCQSRNQTDPNCVFCHGTGTLIVYPTSGE